MITTYRGIGLGQNIMECFFFIVRNFSKIMRGASMASGNVSMVSDISNKTNVLNVFINQKEFVVENLHNFLIIDQNPVVTPI